MFIGQFKGSSDLTLEKKPNCHIWYFEKYQLKIYIVTTVMGKIVCILDFYYQLTLGKYRNTSTNDILK